MPLLPFAHSRIALIGPLAALATLPPTPRPAWVPAFAAGFAPPSVQTQPNFAQHHLLTVISPFPGDGFASAIAPAGDVDGDGDPDWWVGAPRRPSADHAAAGHVALICGASGVILRQWNGDEPFGQLGAALASGASLDTLGLAHQGDFDGDDQVELAAAAPFAGPGRVIVVSPGSGRTLLTLVGEQAGERFGAALAFVGDLNGDGRSEIAVGAPLHNGGGLHAGRLTVHCGADGAVLWATAGSAFDRYGTSVACAGDLDGDGVLDVLVGAPLADEGGPAGAFNGGAIWALSGVDGSILWSVRGTQVGEQLGQSLVAAPDWDGDGVLDFAVGAPGYDGSTPQKPADADGSADGERAAEPDHPGPAEGETPPTILFDAGALHLRSGATGELLVLLVGGEAGAFAGTVGVLPDLDGDGLAELALGSPSHSGAGSQSGQVRLLGSEQHTLLQSFDGKGPGHWFGAALAASGSRSGSARLAVGAPGYEDDTRVQGRFHILSGSPLALATDTHHLDPLQGGEQSFLLRAPASLGHAPYLLLGCLLSSAGPIHVDGVELPLGIDVYLNLTLTQPNTAPLLQSFGWLDNAGRAQARFVLLAQPTTSPLARGAIAGLRHGFLVFDSKAAAVFASNAAPLFLTPSQPQ